MFTFILILLLVAAVFGVLGAVLKVALVLVLSLVLAVSAAVWGVTWYARHRLREWQDQFDRSSEQVRRRRDAYDVDPTTDDRPPGQLGQSS